MSKAKTLSLSPTQFALGMQEVAVKKKKIAKLPHSELDDFLEHHRVPVVIAPKGRIYLIDHHHLVRAAWEAGIEEVKTEVVQDLSKLSPARFWERLTQEKWHYLYDQFGKGPHSPDLLPLDVRGLADDPFRSLAWAVRENQGFKKSATPFSEFLWAEFFRKHLVGHPLTSGFEVGLKSALELCHLPEAKTLPGYVEPEQT